MVYYPYEPGMTKAKVAAKTNGLSYAEKKIIVTEEDVHFQDGRAYVTNVEAGKWGEERHMQKVEVKVLALIEGLGLDWGFFGTKIFEHGMSKNGEDFLVRKNTSSHRRILNKDLCTAKTSVFYFKYLI